jgi:probable addiction module antidote protein/putative addiction module killer protein
LFEVRQTEAIAAWFSALRDRQDKARIGVRIDHLALGNPGDVRPVGEGVSELRIDYGPGYRVYFVQRERRWWFCSQAAINVRGAGTYRSPWRRCDLCGRSFLAGLKTLPWKTEDHLETPEDIAAYLEAVFEDGDPELITCALGAVARSKGMTEIARKTRLGRQNLYKALSPDGHPEFATVLSVVRALGLKLTVSVA